jgi:hypothetical protein
MELESEFRSRIERWGGLSRWERSELGKDLRRLGLSYGEIMDLIPVKKSTLATWCRDVRLTEEQYKAVKERTYGSRIGVPVNTQRKRHREIELIKAQAMIEALHLQVDPFWAMGVALYWAEGFKTKRRLEMAHSEPEALRLFVEWIRRFHDPAATFAASLNLHFNNDEPRAREYWSAELGIDLENFTKTFIKPEGTGHRKNHLPFGVCRVSMRTSANAFVTTLVWVDFVKERFPNVNFGRAASSIGRAEDS